MGADVSDRALETSLVEWKHAVSLGIAFLAPTLGNFLSGMETCPAPYDARPGRPGLGNFLSGMETTVWGSRRLVATFLGNFLSGMETHFKISLHDQSFHLGNFLSGMETTSLSPNHKQ